MFFTKIKQHNRVDHKNKYFWGANQHIRMKSEASCDTED